MVVLRLKDVPMIFVSWWSPLTATWLYGRDCTWAVRCRKHREGQATGNGAELDGHLVGRLYGIVPIQSSGAHRHCETGSDSTDIGTPSSGAWRCGNLTEELFTMRWRHGGLRLRPWLACSGWFAALARRNQCLIQRRSCQAQGQNSYHWHWSELFPVMLTRTRVGNHRDTVGNQSLTAPWHRFSHWWKTGFRRQPLRLWDWSLEDGSN